MRLTLLLAFVWSLLAPLARAHDGPPYPLFVDEDLDGWTVSVWADPDVGTGTFYYYLTAPPGHATSEVVVEAVSYPLEDADASTGGASVASEPGEPFQQIGTVEYSHRGTWPTRFVLRSVDDPGRVLGELHRDLEVTPPGLGTIDILWFAFPFLALGVLWLRAMLAQRAHDRVHASTTDTP